MPSSKQRFEVWKGLREKTSGGLRKSDLIKNKRGKIVSKRKSGQASSQNNLGNWLREKGKSVPKDAMLRKKGKLPEGEPQKPKAQKPKPKPQKAKPKPKPQKAKPKPPKAPKPSVDKKLQKKKPAPKPAPKKVVRSTASAPKGKAGPKINPLTNQPAAAKSGMGYVAGGNVSLDNVQKRKLRPRRGKRINYNEDKMFDFGF